MEIQNNFEIAKIIKNANELITNELSYNSNKYSHYVYIGDDFKNASTEELFIKMLELKTRIKYIEENQEKED